MLQWHSESAMADDDDQSSEDDVHETTMEFEVEQTTTMERDRKKAKKTSAERWRKMCDKFFEQKKTHKLLYKRKYTPNKMKIAEKRRNLQRKIKVPKEYLVETEIAKNAMHSNVRPANEDSQRPFNRPTII